jgi:hypothetical protein
VWIDGQVNIGAVSWLRFDGLRFEELDVSGANHFVFDNGSARFFNLSNITNSVITDSTIGPNTGGSPSMFIQGSPTSSVNFNHDLFDSTNSAGCINDVLNNNCHDEAIFFRYANGLTIRRSTFKNYWQFAIFLSSNGTTKTPTNVTIENNFFGCPNTSRKYGSTFGNNTSGLGAANILDNWKVDYNTFCNSGAFSVPPHSNIVIRSNYGQHGFYSNTYCPNTAITWSKNVWVSNPCPGDSPAAPLNVVDPSITVTNLHLNASSGAIGKGDPNNFPSTDIDGQTRTSPPDAGADQH